MRREHSGSDDESTDNEEILYDTGSFTDVKRTAV